MVLDKVSPIEGSNFLFASNLASALRKVFPDKLMGSSSHHKSIDEYGWNIEFYYSDVGISNFRSKYFLGLFKYHQYETEILARIGNTTGPRLIKNLVWENSVDEYGIVTFAEKKEKKYASVATEEDNKRKSELVSKLESRGFISSCRYWAEIYPTDLKGIVEEEIKKINEKIVSKRRIFIK